VALEGGGFCSDQGLLPVKGPKCFCSPASQARKECSHIHSSYNMVPEKQNPDSAQSRLSGFFGVEEPVVVEQSSPQRVRGPLRFNNNWMRDPQFSVVVGGGGWLAPLGRGWPHWLLLGHQQLSSDIQILSV